MPLSLEEVAADFTRWVEALDPASPTCARDAWQAFMTHVQRPLHWLGPRAPDELDDVWDVTSGQPRDDRVVVQLQRRIVRYSAGGDYDGEAIAACVLLLAPEGGLAWSGSPSSSRLRRRRRL